MISMSITTSPHLHICTNPYLIFEFMLTPYHTHRDPQTRARAHATPISCIFKIEKKTVLKCKCPETTFFSSAKRATATMTKKKKKKRKNPENFTIK